MEEEEEEEQEEVSLETRIEWLGTSLNIAWNTAQAIAEILNRGVGGRENSLCITKIEEALHWFHDTTRILEGHEKIPTV